MLLKGMIITCSSHIQEERTIGSVYYLLTGKRSIQTVQDAYIYNLDRYYGIFKKLNKSTFDQAVHKLIDQQLLTIPSTLASTSKPTAKGEKWLAENQQHFPFTYFNGLTYHEIDMVFLDRLFLLIQVLTNRQMKQSSYIPVIDRPLITKWMKVFYKKIKLQIDMQLENIYHELSFMLATFPEREASMFVDRLTGFQHYGMSIQQLADEYHLTVNDVEGLFVGMTHRMFDMIQQDMNQFPLLSKVIEDLRTSGFMTESTKHTYKLIRKGYSIAEIVRLRRLKINTIYDHIVEISLYDTNFPIHTYVNEETQREIIHAVKQTNTSKLKNIKDQVSEDISYFQIRLTLASIHQALK